MKLNIKAKNFNLTDDIKSEANKKFDRLDKYFHDEQEMDLRFSREKDNYFLETTAFLNGGRILRSETSDPSFQTAIDKNIDAILKQVRKNKTKLMKNRQSGESIRFENFDFDDKEEENREDEIVIARRKEIPVKPMSIEEAVLQMELLDHNFFVYQDAEDLDVRVVYKRNKGDYGVILPNVD